MIDTARYLLPPNSTELEYALTRLAPREQISSQVNAHASIEHTLPTSFQPWLAAEWQLAQFAQYFNSTRDLIDSGLPWLTQRGSAASVKMALSWINLFAYIEEDEFRLQIDPGNADAIHQSADIARLVTASLPAHVQLYRLFHVYDIRHARLDKSRVDACMLDDDSGFYRDGIKLSFGRTQVQVPPIGEQTPVHSRSRRYPHSLRRDAEYLDAWNLDSAVLIDVFSGHGRTSFTRAPEHYPVPAFISYRRQHYTTSVVAADTAGAHRQRRHVAHAKLRFIKRQWTGGWSGTWIPLLVPYQHTSTKG